ncbi:MAG: alpha-isopropylmalate synthase regulatory domain-containing protein [Nanoarchaeota archaeon]|nr:citramalate synthase [Nanoarchaeota archaeon]
MKEIEIYDTTLREGEQAAEANFSFEDRIKLCKKLDDFGVDYIELGWPISSKEVLDSFKECISKIKKAKIVAFGSTSINENPEQDKNLNSIIESKANYACIFGKSCLKHVEKQLRLTPEQNLKRISDSIKFLKEKGIKVFYDAEHYFDAFKSDKEYALKTIKTALESGAEKIILCDTNGGTLPDEAEEIVRETKKELKGYSELGIHFHDDCGLALANTIACLPYIKQVQGTINGIGERVGNLNFSEFLPVYIKKMKKELDINLKELKEINEEAFRLCGINIPEKRAFVGDTAFAHKGGVHTDATLKGASYEHEAPEDFGNKRIILLNTLGGRSCVISTAKEFGYELDKNNEETKEKINKLFEELKKIEKKGYRIGAIKAEQFLIIEKYFGNLKNFFDIEKWKIETGLNKGKEESLFYMKGKINGRDFETGMEIEGGPVDAAYKTMINALKNKYPEVKNLKLADFHVSIAKGKREESPVRTMIVFEDGEEFQTVGVDENILNSAIEALIKGFRYYLNTGKKDVRL